MMGWKRNIMALAILLFPLSVSAGAPHGEYWVCHQSGHIEKNVTVVLTTPFISAGSDDEKVAMFEMSVKQQLKAFTHTRLQRSV